MAETALTLVPAAPLDNNVYAPQSAPATTERRTAVTADMIPRTNVPAKTGGLPYRQGEPPRLTSDGKISEQWTKWMVANLPALTQQKRDNQAAQQDEVLRLLEKWEKPQAATTTQSAGIPTVSEFLTDLHESDFDVFEELVSTVVRQYGHFYGVKTALSPDDLETIPYIYWETAATLPQDQITELILMDEDTRNDFLARETERLQLIAERQEANNARWAQAKQAGVNLVSSVADAYEAA